MLYSVLIFVISLLCFLLLRQYIYLRKIYKKNKRFQEIYGGNASQAFLQLEPHVGVKEERVILVVDEPNCYRSADELNLKVSYSQLFEEVRKIPGKLVKASLYLTGVTNNVRYQKFVTCQKRNGFTVIERPIAVYSDGIRRKDIDIWIVTDLLAEESSYDRAIIVSGDGDYARALKILSLEKGKKIEVWAFPHSTNSALVEISDEFVDITQRGRICRPKPLPKSI